jgi:hypothetical protein
MCYIKLNNPVSPNSDLANMMKSAPDEAAKASILRVKDRANAQIVAEEKKQKKAFGGLFDRANAKEAAAAAANK